MWIPKPVYDYAPLFWLALGLLFLAGAVYLGFPHGLRAAYYVFAVFCLGHAAWTFIARLRFRQQQKPRDGDEAASPVEHADT